MTTQDKQKWNKRYLDCTGGESASGIVSKYLSFAPKGRALDIACGNGRNTICLARAGFEVDAVDISDVALTMLPDTEPRINKICLDLDSWQIPRNRYQLVINIRFLDRRLFPMIKESLTPGGILVFESFIHDTKDYCLKPNELLHAFNEFRILYYEEKANPQSEKFDQSVYMVAQKTGSPCILK
ncbi:MAG: methyltransferase domain-containing protein [Desulfobacterales bacterium]|nr:methyltransferase domain-containing protein [Desulfobacterales bacterium]